MATLAKTPRSTMITLASTSSGPFILTFRLFDTDAIRVYRNGEVETGYTLDATFDDGYTDSASITLDVAGEPGDVIIIDSDLNPHRAQDYLRGDPNIVDKLNIELARIWAAIRDTRQKADRSLRSFQDEEPVSGEAGQVLMIGENGFDAGPTADEVSAAQGYAESAAESAATAALLAEALETAAYGESIPFYVAAAPQTIALPTGTIVDSVFISGLAQQRGASWTQSGNILWLNEPGAIGMYGWYRYRIMEGEFAGQSNTFNGRSAAVAAANGVAWPVGSIISDGTVEYRYAGAPVVGIADMPGWAPKGDVRFEHFGAVGDGVTDNAAALAAALAYGGLIQPLTKIYATSQGLSVTNGVKLRAACGFWERRSTFTPADGASYCSIKYIGPGGPNSYVCKATRLNVGQQATDLTPPSTDDLLNFEITGIDFDANNLADFGLYAYRAGNNSSVGNVTARNAKKRNFLILGTYAAKWGHLGSFECESHGVGIGEDYFGWGTVEHTNFSFAATFHLVNNGTAGTYVKGSATDLEGSGGIFVNGRGSRITITSEGNRGRAFIAKTRNGSGYTDGPCIIIPEYLEANGDGPHLTVTNTTLGMVLRDGFLHPGNAADPATDRFSGSLQPQDITIDAPGTDGGTDDLGQMVLLERLIGDNKGVGFAVNSDTYKYRVRDCSAGIVFTNRPPRRTGIFARAYFKPDSGLTDTRSLEGATLSRIVAGQYRLTFSKPQYNAHYGVALAILSSSPSHHVIIGTKTTTYVDILLFTAGGTQADSTLIFVDVMVARGMAA